MQNKQIQPMHNVLIMEYCSTVGYNDLYIVQEEKTSIGDISSNKVIFRTRLQTANEVNGNNRWYSNNTINEIVNGLRAKAKNRALFMEIDHPFVAPSSPTDDSFKRRAVITELKNCGALIRNIYTEGNDVIAEIETLTGFKGPDLRSLIVEDKANFGFSLRMFGRVKPHEKLNNVMEVVTPLRPITYDVVSNPSHSGARIMSILTESESLKYMLTEDSDYVSESEEIGQLITESNVCIPGSSKEECSKYIMSLISESFDNVKPLKFKI
jgi:hypothetical protein